MESKFETTLCINIWFSEVLKVTSNQQSVFETELKALWSPCLCSHWKSDMKSYPGILHQQGFYDSLPYDFPLQFLLIFFGVSFFPFKAKEAIFCVLKARSWQLVTLCKRCAYVPTNGGMRCRDSHVTSKFSKLWAPFSRLQHPGAALLILFTSSGYPE